MTYVKILSFHYPKEESQANSNLNLMSINKKFPFVSTNALSKEFWFFCPHLAWEVDYETP